MQALYLFGHDDAAVEVFMTAPTEDVVAEREGPDLVGHHANVGRHARHHVSADPEVGEIESVRHIQRSDFEHDRTHPD